MGRREGTPLFNTCPNRYRFIKPKFLTKIVTILLIISLAPSNGIAEEVENTESKVLLDVHVLDSTCLTEESCNSWRPSNLIEYFGADWCEPCMEVEEEISNIDSNQSVIIQHHPSPSDLTFFQQSNMKFENQYRLLFIPSIVINGESLLTGSSQALEINQVLHNQNNSFTGISDINYHNGTLFWNASEGYNLNIWKLEETKHEFENYSHPNLATSLLSFKSENSSANISQWLENWDGRLVFMLEDIGSAKLVSASSQPTGNFNFNNDDSKQSEEIKNEQLDPSVMAIITGLIMLAILLPALIMFQGLRKFEPGDTPKEEE
tara:strand:+ start:1380 stop:2339 length:960 start_codon:yes stop_codon:yes gene_type:complete